MTEEPENLTVRSLRRIDQRLEAIEQRIDSVELRLRGLENQTTAALGGIDGLRSDVKQIQRRLDLASA
jgi:archaellum component FlaC